MTPAQRAELRALAKAATPGERRQMAGKYMSFDLGETPQVFRTLADADEALILACSPEVIEGLLDDLDAAEQRVDALGCIAGNLSLCGHLHEHAPDMCPVCIVEKKLAALEAREKRLREALEQAVKRINGAALHQMHEAAEDEVREALLYLGAALAEPDAQGTL